MSKWRSWLAQETVSAYPGERLRAVQPRPHMRSAPADPPQHGMTTAKSLTGSSVGVYYPHSVTLAITYFALDLLRFFYSMSGFAVGYWRDDFYSLSNSRAGPRRLARSEGLHSAMLLHQTGQPL